MQAFRSLAYLDVEKTGTEFVSRFLRDHVGEPELVYRRHGLLEAHPPPGRIHVISVRHPMDQYLSLFSYGCEGRGEFYREMENQGLASLYEPSSGGFRRWVEFVLEGGNASVIPNRNYYRTGVYRHVGLMSFRLLRLAIPNAVKRLRLATSYDDVREMYRTDSVVDYVIHTETLGEDLEHLVCELAARVPWRPSTQGAVDALRGSTRVNVSERVDDRPGFSVPDSIVSLVRGRERLLFDEFGYR